jgi:hypothetical protein
MLNSDYRRLCEIALPYAGRQMYVHSFDLADPKMAAGFEDYLETVRLLCHAAGAHVGIAHMTVDEKLVTAGMSQRRPKPHVDGCFMPPQSTWGHPPSWAHGCNNVSGETIGRMAVIVASTMTGCRAWRGLFDAEPASDGDLSWLALSAGEVLERNVGYLLSPDCVHESMIQVADVRRTFLRIALPLEFTFA